MSEADSGQHLSGKCMCGAVKFTAFADKLSVVACHCDMCRRWSAGPFMAINCREVEFEGDENISRLRSSSWAERGHCSKCGSNLFYHLVEKEDYQMAAGLVEDQSELRLSLQVFVDRKPAFYEFANETKMLTEAQIFAMYAPPEK